MHRFYLPPEQCRGPVLTLDERESHHAADVLRVRPGGEVTVLNGAGIEFLCQVKDVRRKAVNLTIISQKNTPPLPCPVTLVQSVPKGKLMDLIIQKSTELGVARILPLLTERVTTHLDDAGAGHKSIKWQQVAIEAVKQCGQPWLPQVLPPVDLKQLLSRPEKWDMVFVGSLQGDGRHPREHFNSFHGKPKSLALWIGPEGDFTDEELDAIRASGALPITLGPLVLRCETAALYALSIVQYELSF